MPGSSSKRKPVRGRGVGGRRSGWEEEWVGEGVGGVGDSCWDG